MERRLLTASFLLMLGVLALEHALTDSLKVVDSHILPDGMVEYAYVGEVTPALLEPDEIVGKRTETSYTVSLGEDEQGNALYRTRAYTQPTYVQDGLAWHVVEYGSATHEEFLAMTRPTTLQKLARIVATPTYAVQIFSGAGDGTVEGGDPTDWDTAHDASTGDNAFPTTVTPQIVTGSVVDDYFQRGFFPFDTSSIPSGATIDAASFNVYVTATDDSSNNGNDFISVVQTSQATHTTLTTADFDQCGAVLSAPTEGVDTGQRKDITSISTSAYLTFTLNATGMGWIAQEGEASNCSATAGITCLGLREGHDILDVEFAEGAENSVSVRMSEQTGTSEDPYLDITYTEEEGGGTSALIRPPNNLGLIGYWSFNEGTTTVAADYSGSGYHADFVGDTVWSGGKRGGAIDLDGDGDYVQAPSLTPPSRGTIALWLKGDAFSGARRVWGTDTNFEFVIADGAPLFDICGATSIAAGENFDANKWYHAVVTWDDVAETQEIYVNGAFSASDTATINCTQTAAFLIGRRPGAADAEAFLGLLDEVRMYSRELSAPEVAALYRAGATRQIASSKTLTQGSTLGQGLVGLWTFDGGDVNWTSDTAGVAYDRSGNENIGTFAGVRRSSSTAIGKLGQALSFDGSGDTVQITSASSLNPTHVAACMWAKQTGSGDGESYQVLLDKQGTNFPDKGYTMLLDEGTPAIRWRVLSSGSGTAYDLTSSVNETIWHHYCGTFDGTDSYLYVDGVEADSITAAMDTTSHTVPLTLGANEIGTGDFQGVLDDVRVYNRALSAAEVLQLYRLGRAVITP